MKKILIPVDGSDASVKAAEAAVAFARQYGSGLTLLTVVDEIGYGTAIGDMPVTKDYSVHEVERLRAEKLQNGREILDMVLEKAVPSDLSAEQKVITGMAAAAIVQEARAGNYDLIVMGRRGLSKMERLFVGSVTQRVLSETPCAVYIEKETT